ncbi:hypothetical protein [Fodinicola feengrottensis]|nr:hypothetical protein [Fodinicola feengrottensis]
MTRSAAGSLCANRAAAPATAKPAEITAAIRPQIENVLAELDRWLTR